ncbi:DUF3265 domain-containing protein, partial [Vibrio vulnificus]|nr:DUF3265 domain-containing protein [Vibrio vulnificus]
VCGEFCGENGLRKLGLGGTHPLTQRYATGQKIFYIYLSRSLWQSVFGVGNFVLSALILESLRP